jgi:hypothetical protein
MSPPSVNGKGLALASVSESDPRQRHSVTGPKDSRIVDTDRNGMISMSELSAYIDKRLTKLTDGYQQLGLDQRFLSDIFVAGL